MIATNISQSYLTSKSIIEKLHAINKLPFSKPITSTFFAEKNANIWNWKKMFEYLFIS